jgi:type I restriction enzyme S subunit
LKDRNENRPGYKKTKVGWIPIEWNVEELKNLTMINPDCLNERTPEHYSFYYLDLSSVKEGILKLPSQKVLFVDAPSRARRVVNTGDVLLATVRPYLKGFAYIDFDETHLVCSTGFAVLRSRNEIDGRFIYYSLYSPYTSQYFYGCVVGSGYPALNNSDVERLRIATPPLFEQKKIAEILSTWDKAIEQMRKLIDGKKRHKKALMQQLLTGKKQFKDNNGGNDWRIRPLGELIEPVSRPVPKPKQPYLSIGIRSHGKGTFQKIVEQPEKVMMETLYRLDSQDIVVNITFAWEGAIAIATEKDKGGLVSHRFPTYRFREKEADIDFFRSLFLTKRFVWDLGLISPGGAGRNRVMNQKDFLKLKVYVPAKDQQRELGKILSAADNELRLCDDYLKALEQQKRGLMQKLLTGEILVKT